MMYNNSHSSRSSSLSHFEISPENSSLNEFNSSSHSNSYDCGPGKERKSMHMCQSLAVLRSNLSEIESIVMKHCKVQQDNKVAEQAKHELKKQFRMNKEIMEGLQGHLEELKQGNHEARLAEADAETELSLLKTKMSQHTTEVLKFLESEAIRQKQITDEKIFKLQAELDHMDWLRQNTLHLKEQRHKLTATSQTSESVDARVSSADLERKCRHLVYTNQDLKSQIEELRKERKSLETIHAIGKTEANNLNLLVGSRKNCVLLSDPKYFEIDWAKEYTVEGEMIQCKKCSFQKLGTVGRVMDHVWARHYGGKFICPYCTTNPKRFTWKDTVRAHIISKHPDVV